MSDLLTMQEVAERFRLPVATLRTWRYRGIGPKSFKLVGRVTYRLEDLEAWVAEQYAAENGAA